MYVDNVLYRRFFLIIYILKDILCILSGGYTRVSVRIFKFLVG